MNGLKEFRVTRVYKGLELEATVTISMRVDAVDHLAASDTASFHIDEKIFGAYDAANWEIQKIIVQDAYQIEMGSYTEMSHENLHEV